uniref:Uncharacterized protein n=1 Tax=Anguilla anguilla TaxID=7936 RepID=A0A0E9VY81_ANGAN
MFLKMYFFSFTVSYPVAQKPFALNHIGADSLSSWLLHNKQAN